MSYLSAIFEWRAWERDGAEQGWHRGGVSSGEGEADARPGRGRCRALQALCLFSLFPRCFGDRLGTGIWRDDLVWVNLLDGLYLYLGGQRLSSHD